MLSEIKRRLRLLPQAENQGKYPELTAYPHAMEYLERLGINPTSLAAIYPQLENYYESEFDTKGHAFTYTGTTEQGARLDRVIFPSDVYPYMLAVDRQERYMVPSKGIGVRSLPRRRMRLDVYPDQSVFLKLQLATLDDNTDMATYYVDATGQVSITDLAIMNGRYLNTHRGYADNIYPANLHTLTDDEAVGIVSFSQDFLERGWELSLEDIAIPSPELTRRIVSAPVETGIHLKDMLR